MNIYSAVAQGAKILKEKFIVNPILDSEILMSKVIKQDRKCVILKSDHVLSKCELYYFQKLHCHQEYYKRILQKYHYLKNQLELN